MPKLLTTYIALVGIASVALVAYLASGVDWQLSTLGEMSLFIVLIVAAGSFPLPVAPTTKADVTTAVLFGAVLLLEPGAAALAGAIGMAVYNVLLRYHGERMRWPWYQYPFNAAATALYVGLASLQFHAIAPDSGLLTLAVAPAAVFMYMVNTALITGAVSAQMRVNPLRFWWMGTKENGPAEVSGLAFGFLGAVVYHESPWTVVALFVPVAIIYVAFSRLARSKGQLEQALSDLEALQGSIVSASKLASIGAISLNLAHQMKNPLAIMLGSLEGMQGKVEEGSREEQRLETAYRAGWRMQELTETFTSIGQQKRLFLNVGTVLNEALVMASLSNQKKIETRWDCPEDLPMIEANPVLIREAFSNIFSNAMDALAVGGLIAVDASTNDGVIVVRISDDGAGMPDEIVAHLFEPFYTTKSKGHGLGLFAVKHILEMYNGGVEIETGRGNGTSVIVRLPVDESQNGNGIGSGQASADTQSG